MLATAGMPEKLCVLNAKCSCLTHWLSPSREDLSFLFSLSKQDGHVLPNTSFSPASVGLTVYKTRGHGPRLGLSTGGRPRALGVFCSSRWVTFDPCVRLEASVPPPRGAILTLWPVNTTQMLPSLPVLPTLSKARSCTFSKAM